jgi:3-oxoacyl-[acyl-carrier-protein] synthase-1
MQRHFDGKVPPFSSTKSATGHTLAASGGIEAIFSVLAIQEHLLLPNLNFQEKMEEVNTSPLTLLLKNQKVDHVLSNSFGFGGNNSSVIFARC